MERKQIKYELYYRVPWPDSQKYMFTDCTTGDEVFTVDDDQAVYVPKSYIELTKIKNRKK